MYDRVALPHLRSNGSVGRFRCGRGAARRPAARIFRLRSGRTGRRLPNDCAPEAARLCGEHNGGPSRATPSSRVRRSSCNPYTRSDGRVTPVLGWGVSLVGRIAQTSRRLPKIAVKGLNAMVPRQLSLVEPFDTGYRYDRPVVDRALLRPVGLLGLEVVHRRSCSRGRLRRRSPSSSKPGRRRSRRTARPLHRRTPVPAPIVRRRGWASAVVTAPVGVSMTMISRGAPRPGEVLARRTASTLASARRRWQHQYPSSIAAGNPRAMAGRSAPANTGCRGYRGAFHRPIGCPNRCRNAVGRMLRPGGRAPVPTKI